MRNTSSAYKKQIKGIREFCTKIIINYADGSTQTLTDLQDFKQLKFVDECSGSSEFELGAAVIGEALITLNNRTGKFDGKNFYGAHISAYAGILVNGKPELLEIGHYIVDEPVSPGISIALTAYDNMILLEKTYKRGITYPATLAQIVQDACTQCGVILESTKFPRNSYIVAEVPEGVTCREILAAVAQLSGCFVKARSNGKIAIDWYADMSTKTIDTLYSKTICTDDVTITGITIMVGETIAQSGADGYRLSISDNILLEEEKAQETADYLATKLVGLSFRPLSVSCQSDPSIEAGDRIKVVDEKGNQYITCVTSTTFSVLEAQKLACNAASPTVNAGKRLSETSKAIIANRKYTDEAMEHERTEREAALEELNRQLSEGTGLYITAQTQDDGSTIYYTHDKPLLEDSMVVCKFTATAMGISTDGGKTYPYGLDVSGTAILERIYTKGLDADYIKTGSIVAKDKNNKIVFSINIDIGAVLVDASCISIRSESAETYIDGIKQTAEDAKKAAESAITGTQIEYYLSESAEKLSGGIWSKTAPSWADGWYMWSRTTITYADGHTTSSDPVCIAGAAGKKGEEGKGIQSITPQYYLSSSDKTVTGGTWSSDEPDWTKGMYIWTRSCIKWNDDTITLTEPVLAAALNSANQTANDAKQDAAQANGEITQVRNEITTVQNGISSVTKAVTECVKKNELGSYGYVTGSELKQTSDSITATFTKKETELTNNTNEVSERVKNLESYVRLASDGVEIGNSDSPVVLKVTNEKLAFVCSGQEVAYFSKDQLFIKDAVVQQKLTMGKFGWTPRSDGSVSLKWLG